MPTELDMRWEGRKVNAFLDGVDVGRITVPHIRFHWAGDCFIDVAGIAGVSTNSEVRRRGVASALMSAATRFAAEHGYSCTAVSTGTGNVARRLYTRAGNVYLFSEHSYACDAARLPAMADARTDAVVRDWETRDTDNVLALIEAEQRPFFGTRQKTVESFHALRAGRDAEAPSPIALVAERAGRLVGYCHRIKYWSGLESELFLAEPDPPLALALLNALGKAIAAAGDEHIKFAVSECRTEFLTLLRTLGLTPVGGVAFMLNIFDLQQLLGQLCQLFQARLSGIGTDSSPSKVTIEWPGESGTIPLDGTGEPVVIEGERETITRVLCGTCSLWEAYLRAAINIRPHPSPATGQVLQTLLPTVPFEHPAVDRW